jgi:hypothetical protein
VNRHSVDLRVLGHGVAVDQARASLITGPMRALPAWPARSGSSGERLRGAQEGVPLEWTAQPIGLGIEVSTGWGRGCDRQGLLQ